MAMEKRESLLARYERVLGRPLPGADAEDVQIEASDTQRNPSRRREQVLNAQRTHRHRTQQYIRELEKEVFKLRDHNDELQRTVDQLQAEMFRTNTVTTQEIIASKEQNYYPNPQQQMMMNTWNRGDVVSQAGPQITINLTNLANVYPQGSCSNNPAETDPPMYQPSVWTATSQAQSWADPSQPNTSNADEHDALTVQRGINFILGLETPCLPHVKHTHMGYSTGTTPKEVNYNTGPGHLLTTSAMLTHRYHDQVDLESTPFMMSGPDVERLLEASARLKLDGELTPVQIWERIREVSRRGRFVSAEEIDELLKKFEQYVFCNSFGAVVEKSTVEAVLMEWLGVTVGQNPEQPRQ